MLEKENLLEILIKLFINTKDFLNNNVYIYQLIVILNIYFYYNYFDDLLFEKYKDELLATLYLIQDKYSNCTKLYYVTEKMFENFENQTIFCN